MKGETIKPVFIEKTMNANELADELAFKHIAGDDSGAFSSKIITMLRAQADLIDSLRMGQPNIDYDKELLKPTFVGRMLTNKEILELWDWDSGEILATDLLDFADAILRKTQE